MTDTQTIGDAIRRAERTVTLRPERGQRVYRNTARLRAGTFCEIVEGQHVLQADVGRALGGLGIAPSPSMILRAALTSCVAIGVKQAAARVGVEIDAVDVTLETDVDARGQLAVADNITPGFLGIRLVIEVTSQAPRPDIDVIVARSLRYSPLIEVFAKPQTLTHEIRVSEPAPTE